MNGACIDDAFASRRINGLMNESMYRIRRQTTAESWQGEIVRQQTPTKKRLINENARQNASSGGVGGQINRSFARRTRMDDNDKLLSPKSRVGQVVKLLTNKPKIHP